MLSLSEFNNTQELYEEKEQELWVELQKNDIVKMLYELLSFTKRNESVLTAPVRTVIVRLLPLFKTLTAWGNIKKENL